MSTSTLKTVTIHSHPGPNPWKSALLLTSLGIPYRSILRTTSELKTPSFLAINRNGLSPVLSDPNTGLLLAESGAIQDYILDRYDPQHRISFSPASQLKEAYAAKQWMYFQVTTQGPALQKYFRHANVVPIDAVKADAVGNVRHFLDVLEHELSTGGTATATTSTGGAPKPKDWLVGGRCTAADLVFVPFHSQIANIMGSDCPDVERDFPHVDAWMKRMMEMDAVQKVRGEIMEAFKELGPRMAAEAEAAKK
ncbi:MAG: glutathione S- transferase, nitrogen catabolite repression regulator [Chrysothrix sp. TS-e1954]|nr:MAG: glutathione S- transferase, nitrogen catabolite repression regulator [Chrysothrix sp. TS-e1954]